MLENLRNKKIALLGFGKEGQATFKFLLKNNIQAKAVLDRSESLKPELAEQLNRLKISFVGGENYLDNLNQYDVLFRSPGLPRLHPKLLAFNKQDQILSHTKLFFDLCPCEIIAVTGTKGKTTTVSLIYEILKNAGKDVYLGGNIGHTPLDFIDLLKKESVVVLEVSSFQSQDLQKSPHIGVILNVTEDHMDDGSFRAASHSSHDEYLKAKANLIAYQSENDFAILHPALKEIFTDSGRGKKIIFNPEGASGYQRKIIGKHNLENIAAAVAACRAYGVAETQIRAGVSAFKGAAQRLEVIAEKNGIKYVNDSASTNPDSTIAAVNAFHESVILIVGGSDKKLDYNQFGKEIINTPQIKALIVIGEITPKIIKSVYGFQGMILTGAKNMKEIVEQANSVAQKGDVVLLSPASASFDMFVNSKDRGEQFNQFVNAI